MRYRSLRFRHLVIGALVSSGALLAGCDDLINDATFKAWCGDKLCNWTLESGSVRKAPTWHPNDYGVELVDTPTAISQSTDQSAQCITFTTVADIDPSAQVYIGLDFNRDGTIDYETAIAATGFHEAKTQVTPPAFYDGVRFVITKKGTGHAVLAEIRAKSDGTCGGAPLVLHDQALGTPCASGDACRSHVCCAAICAECCTGGAPAAEVACPNGEACSTRVEHSLRGGGDGLLPAMPMQCNPAGHDRPSGTECVADDDCASGACDGERVDGFTVDGGLAACTPPINPGQPDGGSDCIVSLVHGGRCR
jgi:hypothetical protein